MAVAPAAADLERRKQVKLRLRRDLSITPQKYEGRTYFVVKDPVTLRYYRFKEQEHYLLSFMNGENTLEDAQKAYEKRYRPERLTLEDLEGFAQQLLSAGLVLNESPRAGQQLIERRRKRQRTKIMQALTNILYIKIPLFDPDRLLTRMVKYYGFFFSIWFFVLALGVMIGALFLVLTHFDTFRSKLPSYQEFFSFKTIIYLWIALGVVKVIHEFGHGLSCKKFGGEVHEMGLLFLVFSPAMYCNVSDSWTLPSKWKRIVISAAGIYVELMIAAIATFVWWNTPTQPFINNLALSLMVVCSVSTIVFNANPLMRYDGYYVLADWIEIPNLRERSNRFIKNLFLEKCLGVEVQPEPYMALWRRWLFVIYAITAYLYRWVVTFFILYFLYNFLRPYKLGVISGMLALAALGSMIGWPLYNLIRNIHRRGRLPDMKPIRVTITVSVFAALIIAFFTVPLPVSRIHAEGVVQVLPEETDTLYVFLAMSDDREEKTILTDLYVRDGQQVKENDELARFKNRGLEVKRERARKEAKAAFDKIQALRKEKEDPQRTEQERKQFEEEIVKATGEWQTALENYKAIGFKIDEYSVVKATRAGIVTALPKVEQIGRQWDPKTPLCKIGSPEALRVLIPVVPGDYNLLEENLGPVDRRKPLAAEVRVHGLGTQTWRGRVSRLPGSEAATIPVALSNRANGPVAIKPSQDPEQLVPQTQQYLVEVDLVDDSANVPPGVRARVKVHCRKRTLAWWVWRTINDTFNLGLI